MAMCPAPPVPPARPTPSGWEAFHRDAAEFDRQYRRVRHILIGISAAAIISLLLILLGIAWLGAQAVSTCPAGYGRSASLGQVSRG